MKMKKLSAVFKKAINIDLYSDEQQQWISNGQAVYSLKGMPPLTPEQLATILDLPSANNIRTVDGLPFGICFDDMAENEKPICPERIQLPLGGGKIATYTSADGERVIFIEQQYLEPINAKDHFGVYERRHKCGITTIAVKNGMFLEAMIEPRQNVITPDLLDETHNLLIRMNETYERETAKGGKA